MSYVLHNTSAGQYVARYEFNDSEDRYLWGWESYIDEAHMFKEFWEAHDAMTIVAEWMNENQPYFEHKIHVEKVEDEESAWDRAMKGV